MFVKKGLSEYTLRLLSNLEKVYLIHKLQAMALLGIFLYSVTYCLAIVLSYEMTGSL